MLMLMLFTGGFLAVTFVTDITKRKISNFLNAVGAAIGLLAHGFIDGWHGLGFSLLGLAAGFVPMLLLYMCRAVAAGDVKLFAALGALTGPVACLYIMTASLLFAGGIALLILAWRSDGMRRLQGLGLLLFHTLVLRDGSRLQSLRRDEGNVRFPFMWAVLPGAGYAWYSLLPGMF